MAIISKFIILIIALAIICVSIWGCSLLIGDIRYSMPIMIFVIASGAIAGFGWFGTGTLSPIIGGIGGFLLLVATIMGLVGLFIVSWKFLIGVYLLVTIGLIIGKFPHSLKG